MVGSVYGRWTVLSPAANRGYRKAWLCRCQCGKQKEVLQQNLTTGRSLSCGCYSKDIVWRGHGSIPGTYWSRLKHDAMSRNLAFDITIDQAWSRYMEQGGRCALSGIEITFAKDTKAYWASQTTASLDRIDSSRPYVMDNIQWVHKDINKMKQNLPESRFIELCQLVSNHAVQSKPS